MQIGEVIRKNRKNRNLTQEEMASRLGVTAPAVNKWENGVSLKMKILHRSYADFCSTDTARGPDNKKRRYVSHKGSSISPFLVEVPKGSKVPIWHATLRSKV